MLSESSALLTRTAEDCADPAVVLNAMVMLMTICP